MTYFVYNKRKNQYTETYETVSTTFDLICDRSFLIGLAISICCFGAASAKPIVAWFSKHFGLRNFSVSVCCFTGLCYMIMSCSPNLTIFMFFQLVLGMNWVSLDIIGNIYMSEIVGPSKRHLCGVKGIGALLGQFLTVGIAFFIPDWRKFSIAIGVAHFFGVIMLLVPKSYQNCYGRAKFKLGSSTLRDFGKRLGVPLGMFLLRKNSPQDFY